MGKYMSFVLGAATAVAGLVALSKWWCDFLLVMRGMIPLVMIFGGAIAMIAGISEIKDETAGKKKEKK